MNAIKRTNSLLPDVFGKEKELSATFSDSESTGCKLEMAKNIKITRQHLQKPIVLL